MLHAAIEEVLPAQWIGLAGWRDPGDFGYWCALIDELGEAKVVHPWLEITHAVLQRRTSASRLCCAIVEPRVAGVWIGAGHLQPLVGDLATEPAGQRQGAQEADQQIAEALALVNFPCNQVGLVVAECGSGTPDSTRAGERAQNARGEHEFVVRVDV